MAAKIFSQLRLLRPWYWVGKRTKTDSHWSVYKKQSHWFIPRTPYDTPSPVGLHRNFKKNWELTPVVALIVFDVVLVAGATLWSIFHKVDVVFNKNKSSISRSMDLRNPTIHKMITINQVYEPWHEMQDVLDKMSAAEKQLKEQNMSIIIQDEL